MTQERSFRGQVAAFSAMSGNGPRAPSPPFRAFRQLKARLANTMANSCAVSSCSRGRAARRLAGTAERHTAISFRQSLAGSSRGFALLKTLDPQTAAFRDDVLRGIAAPVPAVPARWLYDRRGSELFDEITRL